MTKQRRKKLVESPEFWSHLGFVLEGIIVSATGHRVAKVFDQIIERKMRFLTTDALDDIYRKISRIRQDWMDTL